jgi:hypothetical protein
MHFQSLILRLGNIKPLFPFWQSTDAAMSDTCGTPVVFLKSLGMATAPPEMARQAS